MTAQILMEKRAALIAEARTLNEDRADENGALGAEDQEQFDRLLDKADELKRQADRAGRLATAEADLTLPADDPIVPEGEDLEDRTQDDQEKEIRNAFSTYLKRGKDALDRVQLRALQADADVSGGYLVAPEQFLNQLIKAVDDQVWIRQWASKYTVTNAASLGVPTLEADPADADWTVELGTGSEDSTMAFGKRSLAPNPLAKRIKVSDKLIRLAPNSVGIVRDRLAYKFGITMEKAGLTGSGAGQPLGVFTASADGINTDRDVSTDNTTTAVTVDGLINAKYTLKGQYWPRAKWLGHRDLFKMVAKLKDGDGQYLWRESVRAGEPDRLLGFPAFMSEYAPNTFTTGLYVGILGDFSNYWIVDSLQFTLKRLDELYAETAQVGFIGRLESDGMPVLSEAFVRVTLA